jgi:membrane fusion protein, heavy metal efflux system
MPDTHRSPSSRCAHHWVPSLLASLLLAAAPPISRPPIAMAGPGHHHGEGSFKDQAPQVGGRVAVDAETAQRMGIKVEPVVRQRLPFGVQTTGQIEVLPNRRVQVTNPTGGTVIRMLVQPGDVVTAGQAVALLSSPDLATLRTEAADRRITATKDVQQAETDVRLAQRTLERQRAIATQEIQQAKAALDFAQESDAKDQELAKQGALPQRTARESQTRLAQAQADYAKATSRLAESQAQAEYERAEAALATARSQVALSDQTYATRLRQLGANANPDGTITITAPISGTVASRESTPGESAQDAGKVLMTIVDSRSVLATASIYEKDLAKIAQGQRVRVTVASVPSRAFSGRITTIGSTVEGETRVIPVKAELDNSGGTLKPGMFAQMEVLTERTPVAVLTIPRSAVVEVNKKTTVFVQNGNRFQSVDVELGRTAGDWVEVKKGLFDGDLIVTQRANQLQAQSLRVGNGGGEDDHAHGDAEKGTTVWPVPLSVPLWAIATGGGVAAVGLFFGGMAVATRRLKSTLATVPPDSQAWQHPQIIEGGNQPPVIPFRKPHRDADSQEEEA